MFARRTCLASGLVAACLALACAGRASDSMGTSDGTTGGDTASTSASEPGCGKVWEGDFDETTPELLVGYSEITGSLSLCCSGVEDLRALSCLQRVEGSVNLLWNDSLTSLAGLENLTHVGYSLQLRDGLLDISALGGLTVIEHDLLIDSPVLTSLRGLDGITRVGEELRLAGLASLQDLQGLGALEEVGGAFRVYQDEALVDLSGVESLRTVGAFEVTNNEAMTSLEGVEGVRRFGERFELRSNDSLTDITGALGGKVDTDARIEISGNPMLPTCEAEKLADSLEPPGYTGVRAVFDNLGACP